MNEFEGMKKLEKTCEEISNGIRAMFTNRGDEGIGTNPPPKKPSPKAPGEYKYDSDKPRLDLVPPAIIEAVGVIRTYGVKKYGENTNWEKVEPGRYRAALLRHLCEYIRNPESIDEESGYLHLWHAACNLAFLCELQREGVI